MALQMTPTSQAKNYFRRILNSRRSSLLEAAPQSDWKRWMKNNPEWKDLQKMINHFEANEFEELYRLAEKAGYI